LGPPYIFQPRPDLAHPMSARYLPAELVRVVQPRRATPLTERSSYRMSWRNDLPDRGYEPDNRMSALHGRYSAVPISTSLPRLSPPRPPLGF
jgi:hypothetical protein